MAKARKTRFVFHMIMTVFTGGFWLIGLVVWKLTR